MIGTTFSIIRSSNSIRRNKSSILASFLSHDTHQDFQPKKKNVPEGLEDVMKLIDQQVKTNDVMLYMKGTPNRPMCGFSGRAVQILQSVGADFSSVNVLEYPTIREGIKQYSEWPTIPQLYVKGEFVGGADIMTNMYNEGQLKKLLEDHKILKE